MYESYDANFSLFVYANTYKKKFILRIITHTNILVNYAFGSSFCLLKYGYGTVASYFATSSFAITF